MSTIAILATGLLLITASQEASAVPDCSAPAVPTVQRPVKPTRPPVPSCVDEARGRHTCSNRVIDAYNARLTEYGHAFDAYVEAVNGYVESLSDYVSEANDYAQCEQRIVMPSRLITG